jgi:Flp pilus assembly protein TadG
MKLKLLQERGQALIIIALIAIGLFGIVALAIDGSVKFSDRRHAQNAADTAAMTAALELARGNTVNWDSIARNIADKTVMMEIW